VLDGDELHCKIFVRPKGPEMLQVIELKGFEEGSEVETRLLRFKVDVKVLSPLRLESQSIVIKDGVPMEWQDEKGWHAIANDFHSDKLSEQRILCWIVISEEIATDKIRSLRIKLNRSLDPLIEVPVQFAQ